MIAAPPTMSPELRPPLPTRRGPAAWHSDTDSRRVNLANLTVLRRFRKFCDLPRSQNFRKRLKTVRLARFTRRLSVSLCHAAGPRRVGSGGRSSGDIVGGAAIIRQIRGPWLRADVAGGNTETQDH